MPYRTRPDLEIYKCCQTHSGELRILPATIRLDIGQAKKIYLMVFNTSSICWLPSEASHIFLGYRLESSCGQIIDNESPHYSRLNLAVEPGEKRIVPLTVIAPLESGKYQLTPIMISRDHYYPELTKMTAWSVPMIVGEYSSSPHASIIYKRLLNESNSILGVTIP